MTPYTLLEIDYSSENQINRPFLEFEIDEKSGIGVI